MCIDLTNLPDEDEDNAPNNANDTIELSSDDSQREDKPQSSGEKTKSSTVVAPPPTSDAQTLATPSQPTPSSSLMPQKLRLKRVKLCITPTKRTLPKEDTDTSNKQEDDNDKEDNQEDDNQDVGERPKKRRRPHNY